MAKTRVLKFCAALTQIGLCLSQFISNLLARIDMEDIAYAQRRLMFQVGVGAEDADTIGILTHVAGNVDTVGIIVQIEVVVHRQPNSHTTLCRMLRVKVQRNETTVARFSTHRLHI